MLAPAVRDDVAVQMRIGSSVETIVPVGLCRTSVSESAAGSLGIHLKAWDAETLPEIDAAIGSIPQQIRLATVARRGVTRTHLSLAPSSIDARILRRSRPFRDQSKDLGFPQKTWNTMARRNQRWRCEYARIGGCDVGRQFAAGDPTPGAAAPSGPRARRTMRPFRRPAPRRV